MKFQFVIPARGGSKRLPNKNIKLLGNKPLIQYSIDLILNNFNVPVWVNTDDENIFELSKSLGANITKRPENLGLDTTPTVDVLKHQLSYFEKNNIKCDSIVLLQPTSPFRTKELILECLNLYKKTKRNSLATFSFFNKKFGRIDNDSFFPENYVPGQRSQDLKDMYFENGSVYITNSFSINRGQIITDDVYPFITKNPLFDIDIDTIEDFNIAKKLI